MGGGGGDIYTPPRVSASQLTKKTVSVGPSSVSRPGNMAPADPSHPIGWSIPLMALFTPRMWFRSLDSLVSRYAVESWARPAAAGL